ncbi:MAG: carboxymuconolactone decarboxylase family protein [Acidimicrobiia bacterium]|nr:carboxymuconolactone decarboxylase family protein [Acidimicrobiia bacterium]
MTEYLPDSYTKFRSSHPTVAAALDALGSSVDGAGPLDPRTMRLVKLALAVAASAPGAVRSNVRKALGAGATPEEVRHVAVAAITTIGFPSAVAAMGWIDEVLEG